ncbi:MAG: sel1 repeat family protein [Synergistaceae bacterium]|nr:sel1 repeat family protein [Synergistaceae bacterium]
MRKLSAAVCLSFFMFGAVHAEEAYDPQHTMLALNMAIVSINRILTTQDRTVLEWEYDNIINRLAFGNIESDPEMIELYQELLGFINGKKLRQEDSKRLRESYEHRQKEAYYRSMYKGFASLHPVQNDNMKATSQTEKHEGGFLSLLSWIGNISISAVSSIGMSYYGYHAEKERIHGEIEGGLWQMQRDEIEACHALQMKLLNSSWRLLRQYRLPDEYMLTEANLAKFFKAMETDNTANRLKMLKMIERDFRAYPVYWFNRARAASDSGDTKESELCFDRFNEVWRPVLRKDCYKVEASKYQISRIIKSETLSNESLDEIHKLADTIQEYSPEDDWSSNLFAGFVYFALGDKEKAVMCLEENVLFGYEKDISEKVLEKMKTGSPKNFTLNDIPGQLQRQELEKLIASRKYKDTAEIIAKMFEGKADDATWERLGNVYTKNPAAAYTLWLEFRILSSSNTFQSHLALTLIGSWVGGDNLQESFADILPIVQYFADRNNGDAKLFLADMYKNGWGIEKDLNRAIRLFKELEAVQETAFYVECSLGECYYYLIDYAEAERHFKKSAYDYNYALARTWLGLMYSEGLVSGNGANN